MKIIAIVISALLISNSVISQPCNCSAAFDYMVEKIEANYSGFKDKVTTQNKNVYQSFTDSLKTIASASINQQQDSCYKVLKHWISFLKDGHVSVGISSNNNNADSIRQRFANWPSVNYSNVSFANYLNKNKRNLKRNLKFKAISISYLFRQAPKLLLIAGKAHLYLFSLPTFLALVSPRPSEWH